ncbi:MAG: hypothetical protein GY874_01600 [Desulfobacteraceae bacterium]|nr:hypothetical protein [Desulfobacteraceae bacterium]
MYLASYFKVKRFFVSALFLLIFIPVISCSPPNTVTVRIKITYKDSNPDNRLELVRVTSAGDITELAPISGGKTRSTRLWPKKKSQPQLFLSYNFKGKRRYWDGPKMPRGKGYKIEVVIGSNGKVIEHKISQ